MSSMQSSPSVVMNGHFAAVGDKATPEQYENGVQVIDENKEFKYVCRRRRSIPY